MFSDMQLETFSSQRGAEFKVYHDATMKVLIPLYIISIFNKLHNSTNNRKQAFF